MATRNGTTPTLARDEAQIGDASYEILMTEPYLVEVLITGTAPILFHAWNCDAVEEKAGAQKNSAVKKTDNLESYVYRDTDGLLCVPGTNFKSAIAEAGRSMPDPRSPRKSAKDLLKAIVQPLTLLAPFEPHVTEWDYEDRQRVTIQRSAVTRTRPAMREGWQLRYTLQIAEPDYLTESQLHRLVIQAGALVGLGDFRPTYGRFRVAEFRRVKLTD